MVVIIFLTGTIQRCFKMEIQGKKLLGNMLVQAGKVDEGQLQDALTQQKENDGYIGQIFIKKGFLDQRELNNYISYQLKIPHVQLRYFQADKSLMDLFSESFIRSKNILPLFQPEKL